MTPFSGNDPGCTGVRERIDLYLDGDIGAEQRVALEHHLADCKMCREELALAKTVLAELRALPGLTCPDGVMTALAGTVGHAEPSSSKRGFARWLDGNLFGMPRPALASSLAAVLIVAVVFGALNGRLFRSDPQPTAQEVADAEVALKWTVAYLSDVGRQTSITLRDDGLTPHLVEPTERALKTLFEAEKDTDKQQQPKRNGGST